MNERCTEMTECLRDAQEALALANVKDFTSEDVRTIGISFFIEKHRNHAQAAPSAHQSPPQSQGEQASGQAGGQAGADHGVCNKCGAPNVLNPKTGKVFCKNKCWLNK